MNSESKKDKRSKAKAESSTPWKPGSTGGKRKGGNRDRSRKRDSGNYRKGKPSKHTMNKGNSHVPLKQPKEEMPSYAKGPKGKLVETKFPHVYVKPAGKFTKFYVEGIPKPFFDEYVLKTDGKVLREVDPERSKLFAAIAKDISQIGIKEDSTVLYLGASHGYTVSFLADVVKQGHIYALDFAPRVIRDLITICEDRENIAPLFRSASQIDTYRDHVPNVDIVFMDIAQRDQVNIFVRNCKEFLNDGGFGLLALKARSIDVSKQPKDIFKTVRAQLEQELVVVDYRELAPYEKDHAFFVVKKK